MMGQIDLDGGKKQADQMLTHTAVPYQWEHFSLYEELGNVVKQK